MIDLIKQYGFTFRGTCNCVGPKTDRYKYGDFVLYYNRRSHQFRLKKYGKAITTLQPEENIEIVLKQYVSNAAVA